MVGEKLRNSKKKGNYSERDGNEQTERTNKIPRKNNNLAKIFKKSDNCQLKKTRKYLP